MNKCEGSLDACTRVCVFRSMYTKQECTLALCYGFVCNVWVLKKKKPSKHGYENKSIMKPCISWE